MRKYNVVLLLLILSGLVFSAERNLTFVVWSDSHFGAYDYDDPTRLDIMDQINKLSRAEAPEGFIPFPKGSRPKFLLHCGDLTEKGIAVQWNDPNVADQRSYLQTLEHLNPAIKTYAVLGNHDSRQSSNIRKQFAAFYPGTYYSFDYKGIHFCALDPYPNMNSAAPSLDTDQLDWLKADLDKLVPETPVIIVMHIRPVYDEAIERSSRLDPESGNALAAIVADKNILAFFHGHGHRTSIQDWHGIPVVSPAGFAYYRNGCKNGHPSLGVVQITDSTFSIYTYNWETREYTKNPLYQKQLVAK